MTCRVRVRVPSFAHLNQRLFMPCLDDNTLFFLFFVRGTHTVFGCCPSAPPPFFPLLKSSNVFSKICQCCSKWSRLRCSGRDLAHALCCCTSPVTVSSICLSLRPVCIYIYIFRGF